MRFTLKQSDVEAALTQYVRNMGIDKAISSIEFSRSRSTGLTVDIEVDFEISALEKIVGATADAQKSDTAALDGFADETACDNATDACAPAEEALPKANGSLFG
jgi:hypothetical protein